MPTVSHYRGSMLQMSMALHVGAVRASVQGGGEESTLLLETTRHPFSTSIGGAYSPSLLLGAAYTIDHACTAIRKENAHQSSNDAPQTLYPTVHRGPLVALQLAERGRLSLATARKPVSCSPFDAEQRKVITTACSRTATSGSDITQRAQQRPTDV